MIQGAARALTPVHVPAVHVPRAQAVDTNGNGRIDRAELKAAWVKWFGAVAKPVRRVLGWGFGV